MSTSQKIAAISEAAEPGRSGDVTGEEKLTGNKFAMLLNMEDSDT